MTIDTAEKRMQEAQTSQHPYLTSLMQRLLLTYSLPLAGALLLATVGAVLLANILPSSTVTALVFALNIGIFYYGWNFLEKRTRATASFTLYVTGSRERRLLAGLIESARKGNATAKSDLEAQVIRYETACQQFIASLQAQ